jgi:hypothetical protein
VAVGIGGARPGSASSALGNAVVLRMNNMDDLQAEHRPKRKRRRPFDFYIRLCAGCGRLVTACLAVATSAPRHQSRE